ncbi:MAG: SH3 domain-containing protein [Bellilinea sp.]
MFKKDTIHCPHCGQQHPAGTTYCPINGLPIDLGDTTPVTTSLLNKLNISKMWIIVGAAVIGAILCLSAFVILSVVSNRSQLPSTPTLVIILPSQALSSSTPVPAPIENVITPTPAVETTPDTGPWQACADAAYLSQLHVGDTAEVSNDPPLANRVRQDAGLGSEVIGSIEPGEKSLILEGPRCANNWVWWKVRSNTSGLEGWTAEGDADSYWLIPVIP